MVVIISIIIFKVIEDYNYDESIFIPPIINDVFKEYRKQNNITIYEMNELFITFTNMNKDKNDQIIFYTLNNSDPRKYGITYDDNKESEIGIAIPISKINNIYKPITVHAVIGRLGTFDQIIWSKISTQTFWNSDHLNHKNFGGGFTKIPISFLIENKLVVRVWPKRLTDFIKCVYAKDKFSKTLKNKKTFWSNKYTSKVINLQSTKNIYLFGYTYIDIIFDQELINNNIKEEKYYVVCSTSSKSVIQTINEPNYSSMLIFSSSLQ